MIKCFIKNSIILCATIASLLLIASSFQSYLTEKALNKYQPVIDDIIEYNKIHNVYPSTIKLFKNESKEFPFYKYETYNNNKNFIFLVSAYEYDPKFPYLGVYRYCTTTKLDGCDPSATSKFVSYSIIGNWVETHYND